MIWVEKLEEHLDSMHLSKGNGYEHVLNSVLPVSVVLCCQNFVLFSRNKKKSKCDKQEHLVKYSLTERCSPSSSALPSWPMINVHINLATCPRSRISQKIAFFATSFCQLLTIALSITGSTFIFKPSCWNGRRRFVCPWHYDDVGIKTGQNVYERRWYSFV